MSSTIDPDLLRPSLTKADDMIGFRNPSSPQIVFLIALICGPEIGGMLFAWNAWRLGLPRQAALLAIGGWVVAFVAYWLLFWGVTLENGEEMVRERGAFLSFAPRILAALVVLFVYGQHTRRFQLFVNCDGEAGNIWAPAAVALVASYYLAKWPIVWTLMLMLGSS